MLLSAVVNAAVILFPDLDREKKDDPGDGEKQKSREGENDLFPLILLPERGDAAVQEEERAREEAHRASKERSNPYAPYTGAPQESYQPESDSKSEDDKKDDDDSDSGSEE